MHGKLVVGNWKMNGALAVNAALLAELVAGGQAAPGCRMAVCVPYPYLAQVGALLAATTGVPLVLWQTPSGAVELMA